MTDGSLVELAAKLSHAKAEEAQAKLRRLAIEAKIIAATGFKKAEGQEKFHRNDTHGTVDLICKQPITTKVDSKQWLKIRARLPKRHPGRNVFVQSFSLDTKAARELQAEHPKEWADIADAITRKPGKIQVEIKSLQIMDIDLGRPPDPGHEPAPPAPIPEARA